MHLEEKFSQKLGRPPCYAIRNVLRFSKIHPLRLCLFKEERAEFPHCDFQVFIGFVTSVPNLGVDVFERFAKTTQGARPLILGIAWIEIVKHSDRAAKEAQLGLTFTEIDFSRGLDNLTASVVRCSPLPRLVAASMPPESENLCAV